MISQWSYYDTHKDQIRASRHVRQLENRTWRITLPDDAGHVMLRMSTSRVPLWARWYATDETPAEQGVVLSLQNCLVPRKRGRPRKCATPSG